MLKLIQPGRGNCATSGSPFLSFATMGKRPGRGAVMRKRMVQEAKYWAKRSENPPPESKLGPFDPPGGWQGRFEQAARVP